MPFPWFRVYSTSNPTQNFLTSLCHSITSSISLRNFPRSLFSWDVLSLSCVVVAKSCLTLCDAVDCSPPGSSVREIFQARILEWVVISSSRRSSWPRDQTHISCISSTADGFFISWAIFPDTPRILGKRYLLCRWSSKRTLSTLLLPIRLSSLSSS